MSVLGRERHTNTNTNTNTYTLAAPSFCRLVLSFFRVPGVCLYLFMCIYMCVYVYMNVQGKRGVRVRVGGRDGRTHTHRTHSARTRCVDHVVYYDHVRPFHVYVVAHQLQALIIVLVIPVLLAATATAATATAITIRASTAAMAIYMRLCGIIWQIRG